MAKTGHQISAKGARISANSTILNFAKWDVDDSADKIDTTNFESGGQGQGTVGIETCRHNGGGLWDAARNSYDSPPAIFPQETFPNMLYYLNAVANVFWNFPLALLLSTKNSAEVRGAVMFDWSGESNGPFSRPTGNF